MAKNNGFEFRITTDNLNQIKEALESQKGLILEAIGLKAETYAKKIAPVGTPESTGKEGYRGGTLRNSITHKVTKDTVQIGSNVKYAPYQELGTLEQFEEPPEWIISKAKKGSGKRHGGGVHAKHFLRDAIQDHKSEYAEIIRDMLS